MANKEVGMTMISVPIEEKNRFKKVAKKDGRTMRALFKIMLDGYEKSMKAKGK